MCRDSFRLHLPFAARVYLPLNVKPGVKRKMEGRMMGVRSGFGVSPSL